ncbi:hypothetical protein CF326_g8727 [Tilletia indica]|nr:hypothetical protein CF326_g8727 [Tilletia indica]
MSDRKTVSKLRKLADRAPILPSPVRRLQQVASLQAGGSEHRTRARLEAELAYTAAALEVSQRANLRLTQRLHRGRQREASPPDWGLPQFWPAEEEEEEEEEEVEEAPHRRRRARPEALPGPAPAPSPARARAPAPAQPAPPYEAAPVFNILARIDRLEEQVRDLQNRH